MQCQLLPLGRSLPAHCAVCSCCMPNLHASHTALLVGGTVRFLHCCALPVRLLHSNCLRLLLISPLQNAAAVLPAPPSLQARPYTVQRSQCRRQHGYPTACTLRAATHARVRLQLQLLLPVGIA